MKFQQRTSLLVGAAAALMLTFSTAAVYPAFAQTDPTPTPNAETPAAPDSNKGADKSADQALGRHGLGGSSDEALATALGITTDELDAAYLQAANAALDQAVAEELLTQTQADTLRERLEANGGNGFHLGGRGFSIFGSDTIDGEALLAEALGITIDELQAAYAEAEAAALAQAVTDGDLTQEQADLLTARRSLQEYWATQQQSYEEIVQAALDAGAITQAQADLLLENAPSQDGRGFGLGGDFGGRGMMPGMGGHGDFGGRGMDGGRGDSGRGMGGHGLRGGDSLPDTQQDDSNSQSNSSFVLPSAGL